MQTLLSALIVAGCAGYVLWTLLLPAAARRRVLRAVGREAKVQAPATPGCSACSGCERQRPPEMPPVQAVHWMPRQRR